jgi:amino acid permease
VATTGAIEQRLDVAFLAYESGLVYTFGGWLFLILCTVDSLIQARTNISPIGMLSQTAKHTITTIDSIFGKNWLILIGNHYILSCFGGGLEECRT